MAVQFEGEDVVPRNTLLARLPPHLYRELLPSLQTIHVRKGRRLLTPYFPPSKVFFPGGGLLSISVGTSEGQMAGVALVGSEGLVGLGACAGDSVSGESATVEIEGPLQAMDARLFRRDMERIPEFSQAINHYIHVFMQNLMQSVACNVLHSSRSRCARCLLEIRDRLERDDLPVTHDAVATMIGVRRASVSLILGTFQYAGMIDHAHKRIAVKDGARLRAAACECYDVINGRLSRLTSQPTPARGSAGLDHG
jgi:CRP-like cAMP-binding protein